MDWPTWSIGLADRLAVTTTVSTSVAAAEPATSGAGATWASASAGAQNAASEAAVK